LVGVDTCPMEGIEPVNYDKALNLAEAGYATVVACAAGYRAEDDKYAELAKVRFVKSEMIDVR
jgi:nitroreductase